MSIYLRPPVSDFGTLEFGSFQTIYDIGYNYAKTFLKEAREKGELDGISSAWNEPDRKILEKKRTGAVHVERTQRDRRNSL